MHCLVNLEASRGDAADIAAAMADEQTTSTARTDFAAAAEWNQDMRKWRDLWRTLDIARAPIPAPMQKLLALFLSGEGAHLCGF